MAREFKPVKFFAMMAVAAFIACGVAAFYTKRAEHGRTAEERQAYWVGEKAGEQAPRDARLPTPAGLNMMAQKYFEQQGSGNQSDWNLAFEHGYDTGSRKRTRSKSMVSWRQMKRRTPINREQASNGQRPAFN
jgi:hypothetical protein